MAAYVTIPDIHRLLLNEEDANVALETLMNKGDQRSHELVVALRDEYFGQPPVCRALSAPISNSLSVRKSPQLELFRGVTKNPIQRAPNPLHSCSQ
jgi:hypothetical protein